LIGDVLQHASDSLKEDREVVNAAVRNKGITAMRLRLMPTVTLTNDAILAQG